MVVPLPARCEGTVVACVALAITDNLDVRQWGPGVYLSRPQTAEAVACRMAGPPGAPHRATAPRLLLCRRTRPQCESQRLGLGSRSSRGSAAFARFREANLTEPAKGL